MAVGIVKGGGFYLRVCLRWVSVSLLLCIGLTGCRLGLKTGHYEGNLVNTLESRDETQVKIEVGKEGNDTLAIDISNLQAKRIGFARVTKSAHKTLKIEGEFGEKQIFDIRDTISPVPAKNPDRDRCYAGHALRSLEFCFSKDRFSLHIYDPGPVTLLRLAGDRFPVQQALTLEDPTSLSLTQAVGIAFQKNFDARIAMNRVQQAREAALAAYLNLVPHLTSNLIWNAAPNYITYIATLQGLAPFLLPSYWIAAKESSIEKEIREVALLITQANLATSVEELAYAYSRDETIEANLSGFQEKVAEFETKLAGLVQFPKERDKLLSFAHHTQRAVESDLGDIRRLKHEDLRSMAKTLGYVSIEAVRGITIDHETILPQNANEEVPKAMADVALERALERKQILKLVDSEDLKKIKSYFMWLDPTGDPTQSLGFNTIPQQKQLKLHKEEVLLQYNELCIKIHQNAMALAASFNEAIHTYASLSAQVQEHELDLDDILRRAFLGEKFDVRELKSSAQKFMGTLVAKPTALANFRIARAKRDRYLLAGFYSFLAPAAQGAPPPFPSRAGVARVPAAAAPVMAGAGIK